GLGFYTTGNVMTLSANGQVQINTIPIQGTPSLTGTYFNVGSATFTDNTTTVSGTLAAMSFNSFEQPTLAAINTGVITTDAATVYIAGEPLNGTNQTITNSWGLWNAGQTRLDDILVINGGTVTPLSINATNLTVAVLMKLLSPLLNAGSDCELQFGVNASAFNSAVIQFNYVGSGNSGNNIGFGFLNNNNKVRIYGTGVMNVAANTASTSNTTGAFTTAGGIASSN